MVHAIPDPSCFAYFWEFRAIASHLGDDTCHSGHLQLIFAYISWRRRPSPTIWGIVSGGGLFRCLELLSLLELLDISGHSWPFRGIVSAECLSETLGLTFVCFSFSHHWMIEDVNGGCFRRFLNIQGHHWPFGGIVSGGECLSDALGLLFVYIPKDAGHHWQLGAAVQTIT